MTHESFATVSKRTSFSIVSDKLFSEDLSPISFKVVAWALGRPDGWKFHISHMIRTLNLTDKTWPRARKELIAAGYFVQTKFRGSGGKICWANKFTDEPLYSSTISIPPNSSHGGGSHGDGRDAGGYDLTKDLNIVLEAAAAAHNFPQIPTPPTPPCAADAAKHHTRPAGKTLAHVLDDGDVLDLEVLKENFGEEAVEDAARQIRRAGKKLAWPRNIRILLESQQLKDLKAETAGIEMERAQAAAIKASAEKEKEDKVMGRFQKLQDSKKEELLAKFKKHLEESNPFILTAFKKSKLDKPTVRKEFQKWIEMSLESF